MPGRKDGDTVVSFAQERQQAPAQDQIICIFVIQRDIGNKHNIQ